MSGSGTTIKDVARAAGVSPATVSRALAGHPRIPEPTRLRIAEVAAKIGYAPNRAAQALQSGKGSGFVGLVLTDPGYGREDSYLGEFISGLGSGLADHGVDLFLSAIPEGQSELSVIRNIVTTRRADGLILARTSEVDARVDYLLASSFPFVTHGRVQRDDLTFPWVDTDGAAAFAEAFDLLYGLGHRSFALLTIEEPMTFRLHRTEGLLAAIEAKADPAVSVQIVTSPRHDAARRERVIHDILSNPGRPTAVIALFDGLALDVLRAAELLGLSVPNDLSVVGFDNIASAAHSRPRLTTFDSKTAGSARTIAGLLVERIASGVGAPAKSVLIRPELVLRASHGPAPPRR
jgi:LacI family transcriptional regulator